MKAIVCTVLMMAVVSVGCARRDSSYPSASPKPQTRAACEQAGGTWRTATSQCDL